MSLKDLSAVCKVAPSAITKWVHGGGIDAQNIAKIAIHFGVTSDWLLDIETPTQPSTESRSDKMNQCETQASASSKKNKNRLSDSRDSAISAALGKAIEALQDAKRLIDGDK